MGGIDKLVDLINRILLRMSLILSQERGLEVPSVASIEKTNNSYLFSVGYTKNFLSLLKDVANEKLPGVIKEHRIHAALTCELIPVETMTEESVKAFLEVFEEACQSHLIALRYRVRNVVAFLESIQLNKQSKIGVLPNHKISVKFSGVKAEQDISMVDALKELGYAFGIEYSENGKCFSFDGNDAKLVIAAQVFSQIISVDFDRESIEVNVNKVKDEIARRPKAKALIVRTTAELGEHHKVCVAEDKDLYQQCLIGLKDSLEKSNIVVVSQNLSVFGFGLFDRALRKLNDFAKAHEKSLAAYVQIASVRANQKHPLNAANEQGVIPLQIANLCGAFDPKHSGMRLFDYARFAGTRFFTASTQDDFSHLKLVSGK